MCLVVSLQVGVVDLLMGEAVVTAHAQPVIFTSFMCPPALVMLQHHNQPPNRKRFCSSLSCVSNASSDIIQPAVMTLAGAMQQPRTCGRALLQECSVVPCMLVRQAS